MKPPYRLYGAELSPYSVKVRAYLRWKDIPHEWIVRNAARQAEFQHYAKLPLIPLLVCADDGAFQDSTPIIEKLEQAHPAPRLAPDDPVLGFLDALIEDYADEWLNKAMFHYRWTRPIDQESGARRIAAMMANDDMDRTLVEAAVRERMTGRLHFVGSSAETAPIIEDAYLRFLAALEAHLGDKRDYLFGAHPTLADFGVYGQLYELLSDPTPGALMRERAPCAVRYVERMDHPEGKGALEPLDALLPTLKPIL
ncbi:MAG: glutathione S-transferase family protein, partial [Hyphomonadaceae bacterium]